MRPKGIVLLVLLLIAAAFAVAGGFLYFFAGGRQMLIARKYVKQHLAFENSLYSPAGGNQHGGILAGVWNDRIWLWAREGLRPFTVNKGTDYSLLIGCNGQDRVRKGLALEEWLGVMRPGDFTFVVLDEANQSIVEKAWGVDYWMFMVDKEIEEQCKAAGRTKNDKD